MPVRRLAFPLVATLASGMFVLSASAHTVLKTPQPLSPDDSAKTGPCGCSFAPGATKPCDANYKVTTVTAGQQLKVTWTETIQHTGKFRVAFSSKTPETVTVADMDAGVVYEGADTNMTAPADISQTVTVPDTPCDLCTIQVRQFMENAASPYYYTCAAVKIVPPGGTGGMGGMGSSSASTGASSTKAATVGSTGAGVGGAGPQYIPEPNDESCSMAPGEADASALLPAVLVAGWFASRRMKRTR
ncbi:MAG: SCE4755 family polysaccharide monooxygenase-like protein [Polyangiaceae bacterium]